MPLPALRNTFFSRSAVVCGACTMQRHVWAHQKTKPPTSWRREAATPLVVNLRRHVRLGHGFKDRDWLVLRGASKGAAQLSASSPPVCDA